MKSALCISMCVLFSATSVFAEVQDQATHFNVNLTDGSRIIAASALETIPLETSFAKLEIPIADIQKIRFDADGPAARFKLQNDDRLTGSLPTESFQFQTIFGEVAIRPEHLQNIVATGLTTSARGHRIRFLTKDVLQHFHAPDTKAWRIRNRQIVGTSTGPTPHLTYDKYFKSFRKVLIRGRIVPPSKRNFRLSVGQINLIFNWEMANQNHYRNDHDVTIAEGHALTPGKMHSIVISQDEEHAVVSVDEHEVYRTETNLAGTVTVYPAGSTIALSEMLIDGDVDPDRPVEGHSHSNTY